MLEQLSIRSMLMKRLLILAGVIAAISLIIAPMAPAFAQESLQYKSGAGSGEEISATGVLKAGLPADVLGDGTHSIVDESTYNLYALRDAGADLDAYVGQPVTVYGTLTPGEDLPGSQGLATSTLDSIDVTSVEALDGGPGEDGEEISVAGQLVARGLAADRADITHYITDEGTGQMWGLISDDPQGVLDPYNGQRVTVTGTDATDFTPGGEEIPAIIVTGVDSSGTLDGNPPPDDVDGDPGQGNIPSGNHPDGGTSGTSPGSAPDQYGDTSGSTSDQYTDGGSIDTPSNDSDASGTGSSAGILGLLPDTGGLSLLTLGLGPLLLVGGGLLGYRFIRQR